MKPIGRKAYGSIPHLPGSRLGPGDHHIHEGQAAILTQRARDRHDEVLLQEKLDGCFTYRTPILTSEGLIPIGKIVNNQLSVDVLTYDRDAGICEYRPIAAYHKKPATKGWIRATARSVKHGASRRQVVCTPDHRFLTDQGYVEAERLEPGMTVYETGLRLSEECKQAILGMLLGDSSILQPRATSRYGFTIGHGKPQSDYFGFKRVLFGPLVKETTPQRGGFDGSTPNRRGYSRVVPDLHELIASTCIGPDGKKFVTETWIDSLTPISLAFWYMDDGSSVFSNRQRPRPRLATNGFSLPEVQRLSQCLRQRFGVENSVHDYKGPTIVLTADGAERFYSLIYPFVPSCMKHKLPSEYRDIPCVLEDRTFTNTIGLLPTQVLAVASDGIKIYEGGAFMFDLTVDGTNNYVAGHLLVHNSNVAVANVDGSLIPIARAGYTATSGRFEQHQHFAHWVRVNEHRFHFLQPGQRIVGEWLAQAHSVRYDIDDQRVFAAFDLMEGSKRAPHDQLAAAAGVTLTLVPLLHRGPALPTEAALELLGERGHHGALDPAEGVMYRCERNGAVEFLAKYVRHDFRPGRLLPEKSGLEPTWNWRPSKAPALTP